MPRFRKNDRIRVNGVDARVISWPATDEGPFRYASVGRNGAEIQTTTHVSRNEVVAVDKPYDEGGLGGPVVPVLTPSAVELVEPAPMPAGQEVSPALVREMRREQAIEDAKRQRDEAQSPIKPWVPRQWRVLPPEPEPGEDPFIISIEDGQ